MRVSRGAAAAVARWLQPIGDVAGVWPFRSDAVCRWLPIPTLTARTLGQFRVVFGLVLLLNVFRDPPPYNPLDLHRNLSWLADWSLVHAVAASATACLVLHSITLALAGLFIVGLWTRPAYVALVAGVFASRLVDLQSYGTHPWSLPLLTLFALTVVPWGDGFSLDARRARRPGRELRAGPLYGLGIWIPGFMLGLAFASAAYAKLTDGGFAWIMSGAVKYHFIDDAATAPLTWGLWVAAHPPAAVLLSLGAIITEACFISIIFVRSPWYRLLARRGRALSDGWILRVPGSPLAGMAHAVYSVAPMAAAGPRRGGASVGIEHRAVARATRAATGRAGGTASARVGLGGVGPAAFGRLPDVLAHVRVSRGVRPHEEVRAASCYCC